MRNILMLMVFFVFSGLFWWGVVYLVRKGTQKNKASVSKLIELLKHGFHYVGQEKLFHIFEGDYPFRVLQTVDTHDGHRIVQLRYPKPEKYPKQFFNSGGAGVSSSFDYRPEIHVFKKTSFIIPALNTVSADYETGESDFDDKFAILSSVPIGFIQTIMENEVMFEGLQAILTDYADQVHIFADGTPLLVTISEERSEQLTVDDWMELHRRMDRLVKTLPDFTAKSNATQFNWANVMVVIFMLLSFSLIFLYVFLEFEWPVLSPDFWWEAALIGGIVGLGVGLMAVPWTQKSHRPSNALTTIVIFSVLSFGFAGSPFLRWVNARFADGPIIERNIRVVDKYIVEDDEGSDDYYVVLEATEWTPQVDIRVKKSDYRGYHDRVDIKMQEGALGVYWIVEMKPTALEVLEDPQAKPMDY